MDTASRCRTCSKLAHHKDSKDIFDSTNKIMLQHIKEVTGIELGKSKALPHLMCRQCQADLSQAYDFVRRVVNSQAYFTCEQNKRNAAKIHIATNKRRPSMRNNSGPNSPSDEVLKIIKYDFSDGDGEAGESEMKFDYYSTTNEFKPEIKNPLSDVEACLNEFPETQNKMQLKNMKKRIKRGEQELKLEIEKAPADVEERCKNMPEKQVKKQLEKYIKRIKTGKRGSKPENMSLQDDEESCFEDIPGVKEINQREAKRKQPPQTFICELCGQEYKYFQLLTQHQRRHTGELEYQCELCSKKFFTSYQLQCHIRTHTGERPFSCRHCGRSFADSSGRVRHERIHTNERPYACHQCGKSFGRSYVLNEHMRCHTGERSFRCDLCNRAFQRKTHLNAHFRSGLHQQLMAQNESINMDAMQASDCIKFNPI